MKCQECNDPATAHVTDLVKGEPVEYHLCEKHLGALDDLPPEVTSRPWWQSPGLADALADPVAGDKLAAYLLPALCLALLDECAAVRILAVFRIWELGGAARSAVGALQDALKDRDERVRKAAEYALQALDSLPDRL